LARRKRRASVISVVDDTSSDRDAAGDGHAGRYALELLGEDPGLLGQPCACGSVADSPLIAAALESYADPVR
jgi:hypothetical protein